MEQVGLPIYVIEADVPVLPAGLVASRGEISGIFTADLHVLAFDGQLWRSSSQYDCSPLPDIFEIILEMRVVSVDLESRSHISHETRRKIKTDKEWHWHVSFLHQYVHLSVGTFDLRTHPPLASQLGELEVAHGLALVGHDSPHVKVRDDGLRIDDAVDPVMQLLQAVGARGAAAPVARKLPAPAQDIAQVIGGPQWHLREGGEIVAHLIVRPDEAVPRVRETIVRPVLVRPQGSEHDVQRERGCAIAASRYQAGAGPHRFRNLLRLDQLFPENIEQAAPLVRLHDIYDVEEVVLIIRQDPGKVDDVETGLGARPIVQQRQGWDVKIRVEGRQSSRPRSAVPIGRQVGVLQLRAAVVPGAGLLNEGQVLLPPALARCLIFCLLLHLRKSPQPLLLLRLLLGKPLHLGLL
mmetsp:Transcript_101394/g.267843  ORF Transcript_101394/g.267843 Transcript_101394/m.267843 type:complete len:409 (+) Transcript_101394:798-2024(+)